MLFPFEYFQLDADSIFARPTADFRQPNAPKPADGEQIARFQQGINALFRRVIPLHKTLPDAFYDVHLMISHPLQYAEPFIKAGATLYNFHLECEDDIQQTLDAVKALGCKTGLTIKPGTAPEALAPYLDQLDLVLVMSVEPGFGGQKFMPSALDKLRWLKAEREKRGLHYLLEVDGGVDDTTAPLCVKAGADVLVAGSAVFGKDDRTAAVRRLAAL